ncbi:MAG: hypothetical protein NVSMB25_18350 [Thermoleophilaceae bacterium]
MGLRPATVLALVASALALAACASGRDVAQVKQTIKAFALAAGPRSCDFLTDDAMQSLFGGSGRVKPGARHSIEATCRARATHFTGRAVKVTRVWFPKPGEAKAYARLVGGHSSYTVTLRRSRHRWRIHRITY